MVVGYLKFQLKLVDKITIWISFSLNLKKLEKLRLISLDYHLLPHPLADGAVAQQA